MYALVGGSVAYVAYRRGRSLLLSSIFRRLFGERHTEGFAGRLVDIFAIIATLFGTAAALGIAALQIGEGVTIVTGVSEITNGVLAIIIAVLMVGFVISAVSGVSRGIRYLSNINIVFTIGIVGLVFFLGPPIFTQPVALCGHGIHWIILRPDGTFGSVGPRNRRLPFDLDRVLLGLVDFVVTIRCDLHRPHFTRQDHPPIYFRRHPHPVVTTIRRLRGDGGIFNLDVS